MRKPMILRNADLPDFSRWVQKISLTSKYSILAAFTLIAIAITFFIERIPQSPAYHQFADNRLFWGIPNYFNVLTNIPFFIIGAVGVNIVLKYPAQGIHFANYLAVFIGVFLTGFGSALYHINPTNTTLVFDRIPLAIIFMAFFSISLAECVNERAARILFLPIILAGIGSVLWWYMTEKQGAGDLRFYGFVQFFPVYIIPLIGLLFPSTLFNIGLPHLFWINITYGIAKCCEYFDKEIYTVSHFISGHSLKHISASLSVWFIVRMYQEKFTE